jgi:hypothetical protein
MYAVLAGPRFRDSQNRHRRTERERPWSANGGMDLQETLAVTHGRCLRFHRPDIRDMINTKGCWVYDG